VMTAALPLPIRERLTAIYVRPSRFSPYLNAATSPIFVWFFYLSAILIWHDPGFVEWEMASPLRQHITLLVQTAAALLFWQQITRGGPRRYSRATYVARVVMLLGVEIPNVIAGMSIAFRTTPLYAWYGMLPGTDAAILQRALEQQGLAGALTWVFGSLVYITSIVLVVNEAFVEASSTSRVSYWW
jgi:cytochrome c oxidase assembly factor CtaG